MMVTERGRVEPARAAARRRGADASQGARTPCVVGDVLRAASAAERLCAVEDGSAGARSNRPPAGDER